jgi:hypothetical protein
MYSQRIRAASATPYIIPPVATLLGSLHENSAENRLVGCRSGHVEQHFIDIWLYRHVND